MTLQSLVEDAKVMTRARLALLVGAVVLVIVILLTVKACRESGNAVPPKEQRTIDSLAIMKPSFDSTAAAGRLAIVHDTVRAVIYRDRVARELVGATLDRGLADSLARLASRASTAADSAREYHAALDVRTREADSLRVAVVVADSAWQAEHAALVRMTSIYVADTLRRVVVERLNAQLAADIKTAGACRFLRVMACPSRGVAFVGGAVLAGAAVYVVARKP